MNKKFNVNSKMTVMMMMNILKNLKQIMNQKTTMKRRILMILGKLCLASHIRREIGSLNVISQKENFKEHKMKGENNMKIYLGNKRKKKKEEDKKKKKGKSNMKKN